MNRLELLLRAGVRKSGLGGPLVRFLSRKVEARRRELRAEYERTKPTRATLSAVGYSAVMGVRNAEEYAHYVSAPEEHIMRAVIEGLDPGGGGAGGGGAKVVWDVGANVGMYSVLLGRAVTPPGEVLAFEPMPWCFERLSENIALNGFTHVRAMPFALGKERATLSMITGSDGLEGDLRVVRDAPPGSPAVEVVRGDDLRREQNLAVPTVVKIDVQGFEEDTLLGLDQTLRDPACRCVIVELHYTIFAKNNNPDAPLRIEKHLHDCGFTNQRRLDRNHIGAWKPA